MRRRFLRAISVTTVGLSLMLGAGCESSSSGPPKVSSLEKTSLTVGAVPVAAVMSIETYPLTIAPDINRVRVQRVADEMLRFHMLTTKFQVSSMLGGL
jgi:hypothetical protein